eukprot:681794-Prymnesium_polylepis.1
MKGGRDGPFMLYSTQNASMSQLPGATLLPLHRCLTNATTHALSLDVCCSIGIEPDSADSNGHYSPHLRLARRPPVALRCGSTARGWETLRALRRCRGAGSRFSHALDLDRGDGPSQLLGFVR